MMSIKCITHMSIICVIICVASLLTACQQKTPPFECPDPIGCVTITPDEPVKLGVLQSLSADVAFLGREQIRGIELAIAKRDGKLLGHPIVLQTEDTGCSGEGGATAALKVVADPQTVAILGTTCSGAAATASKVVSEAGLVMISGNNSAPFLTSIAGKQGPNWQPGYFRTCPNEDVAGEAAATFVFQELGVRKAATINDGDIYTKGHTDGFKQALEKLGGEIVLSAGINKGDTDMQPGLTAVKDSQAELLFFPLFQPEGDRIVLQAKEIAGLNNIILMSDGALIVSTFIESVKSDGMGMYFVGPAPPKGPAIDALASEYTSKYNVSPLTIYYQNAYDASNLLLTAIKTTAVQEEDGTLHIGRQALRDTLYATADFKGVTGLLSCDRFGDCAIPEFNILRLDDPIAGLEGLQSNVMYTYMPEEQ